MCAPVCEFVYGVGVSMPVLLCVATVCVRERAGGGRVCVCEREKERERLCVCMRERERERETRNCILCHIPTTAICVSAIAKPDGHHSTPHSPHTDFPPFTPNK